MKPVNNKSESSEMVSNEVLDVDGDAAQNSLLDALRNTYISEKSSLVFRKATAGISSDFPKVSQERQAVVEEFLQKFVKLSHEEQLLFYLRLPHSPNTTPNLNHESKLGILASRVEIRRTAAWIRSHLQVDQESSIPKRDVYDKYMEYCQYSRMIPISIADFGKVMKQLYPTVRPRRLGTRGQSQYCYSGMNSCQDVLRPNLYEEQLPNDCEQPKDQCSPMIACLTNQPDVSSSDFSKIKVQDCVSDRKCRNRRNLLCHRSRWRRPFCRRDPQTEHTADGPVEDEIAQYFEANDHLFCRPLKIVKSTSRPASSICRSLSYTGGQSETAPLYCQGSVSTHGSPWLAYEHPHNSSCSLHDEKALVRPRSVRSSFETTSTHHCFTPISPSPIPWRPFSSACHTYVNDDSSPFRPRSFSSTEQKWPLPHVPPKPAIAVELSQQDHDSKPNDSNRSQSLPTFKEGIIPQLGYVNGFGNIDMTNDDLSEVLNNSMVVENICDVKIEEHLLPQLDNILESDIMNTGTFTGKENFQMLSQDDISFSEESFRQNLESFF